jgi:hypothetical protein
MKSQSHHLAGLIMSLLLFGACSAGAQEQRQGTLKSVQGAVVLTKADLARDADIGGGVHESDRISTGRNANATLMLRDGTIVTVGPGSTVELTKLQFDSTTQEGNLAVRLLQGSLRMVTGLIAKRHPEQVNVITPTSVVGVRGTDFIVEVP